ncbi:hypothetical protein OJ997_04575 [Solirubrobacter phytolaccae]|uniref:Uncharacterized protein n=1 Tax=Solirubrobacter phytolaccae TaxID=1404360 RepID=A0A9X3N478_9ACTN|nr:hypothetical protein [Solirubrobacter phytolaccae]MDA0179560.1 hypothetical protein [Solirubrobacter phytolaccae]
MRVLDELGREIERVATEAGDVRPRRRWWRPGALFVLLPLCVGTVAVAATTQLLQGEPVRNPPGLQLDPKQGLGVIVGAGKLLPPRTADPAGGPPWGLRVVKTSRGLGCVQLGRVHEGKLGVLGQDFAFDDDGKFHERGAEIIQKTDCQLADAAGNAFIAISHIGLPASGDLTGCNPQSAYKQTPMCERSSLRNVFYGLLGPEATAVTYKDADGKVVRQRVSGPEGAYLVVKPTEPDRRQIGYWSPGVSPGSGLRSVEYRDGSTCMIPNPRRIGGARACPVKGYVTPELTPATREELATPIRVRVGREPVGVKGADKQRRVTFSFRARRAGDSRSQYTFEAKLVKRGKHCSSGTTFGAIAKDVAAGEVVSSELFFPYRCRGRLQLKVGYSQERRPDARRVVGLNDDKVGTVRVDLR